LDAEPAAATDPSQAFELLSKKKDAESAKKTLTEAKKEKENLESELKVAQELEKSEADIAIENKRKALQESVEATKREKEEVR
jgi:hypothetical protein